MMVYVVLAVQGEYSDREIWVAGVFTDAEAAKRLCVEKAALARELIKRREAYFKFHSHRRLEDRPAAPEADSFYLVTVPLDEWGGWHKFEGQSFDAET